MVPLAASRQRPAFGFSLVELMITVAIIGLFSAVVVGSMAETRRRATTRLAAQELLGYLDAVRRSAMASALECRVSYTAPANFSVIEHHTSTTAGQLGLDRCARAFNGGSDGLNLAQSIASATSLHVVAPGSDLLLTPLGTVANNQTMIYYISIEGSSLERCIAVLAPVGFIRSGQRLYAGDSNTADCDYVAGY